MEIWKCKHCNKELELKNKYTISGHKAKCNIFQTTINNILTKEYLEEKYIIEEMSLPEIAEELELESFSTIYNRMKKFGITTRPVSDSRQIDKRMAKAARTNIKRYGAYNTFCRESSSRKEWEQRLFDEEGITNVFQRRTVVDKIKRTCLEKHGVPYNPQRCCGSWKGTSGIHKAIVACLESLGHVIIMELPLLTDDGGLRKYDILVDNALLVEVHGDFWHANPKKYKVGDLIPVGKTTRIPVEKIWQHDAEKAELAKQRGYKLVVVWEDEIRKDLNSVIQNIEKELENANKQN